MKDWSVVRANRDNGGLQALINLFLGADNIFGVTGKDHES